MIAFKLPITSAQATTYKPRSPGEIDTDLNKLIIRCDINDVTNVPVRSGTVINKLSGIPVTNRRDVRYDFVAQEWEFTTYFSVDILDLISEIEADNPNGIPCENYLAAKYGASYIQMFVKFVSIEARGATVPANGIYIPFSNWRVRIARIDIPT